MSSASDQVFGTPELLEQILLLLPPRHLLVSAQRVCVRWRQHIISNLALRRKLFLAAEDGRGDSSDMVPAPRRHSEVLLDRFTQFIQHDLPENEAIQARLRKQHQMGLAEKAAFEAAMNFPSASWGEMHVAQPPVRKFAAFDTMKTYIWPQQCGYRFHGIYDFPDGMRMYELYATGMKRMMAVLPSVANAGALMASSSVAPPDTIKGCTLLCDEQEKNRCFMFMKGSSDSEWRWKQQERMHPDVKSIAAGTDAVLLFYQGDVYGTHWDRAMGGLPSGGDHLRGQSMGIDVEVRGPERELGHEAGEG